MPVQPANAEELIRYENDIRSGHFILHVYSVAYYPIDLDPPFHVDNWVCSSSDAKSEMQDLLGNNKRVRDSGQGMGYIGNVIPVYDLNGQPVPPDGLQSLKGSVVEVVAFISNETLTFNGVKKDNFFADVSYLSVLQPPPRASQSPAQQRGLLSAPSRVLKRK